MNILAVHAHPDDVEILAAGTLALLASRGHQVSIVTATAGEAGSAHTGPLETGRLRQAEAREAAEAIGARYACAGLADLGVFNDDPSRRTITELIRAAEPDLVIAPPPEDYHPDHEAVSLLVRDGCFAASVPNYLTGPAKALGGLPRLYLMDPVGGRDRLGHAADPEFGADIGALMPLKRRMLGRHVSQKAWVLRQHGVDDLVGAMERWSARRGRTFGVAFAEGFRQVRQTPFPRDPLLQTLLGDALLAVKGP